MDEDLEVPWNETSIREWLKQNWSEDVFKEDVLEIIKIEFPEGTYGEIPND